MRVAGQVFLGRICKALYALRGLALNYNVSIY